MNNPWLSLLIPVFNVDQYLESCLNSLVEQLHVLGEQFSAGVEIIVVDDCSTDTSYLRLVNYAEASLHPINILRHQQNRGLSAARNTLLEAASGDYVWFIDSDDILQQGAIAKLSNIVQMHAPDLVLCDYQLWFSGAVDAPGGVAAERQQYRCSFAGPAGQLLRDPEVLFAGMYAKGRLHAWSKISKRRLWGADLRFPEGRYFEDMVTSPRLALRADSFFYCAEPWVFYRRHGASILAKFSHSKIGDMVAGLEGVIPLWKQKHPKLSLHSRYKFARYLLKIDAFVNKELKNIARDNGQRMAHYRAAILTNSGMSRCEIASCFLLTGDLYRLGKFLCFLRKV